MKLADSCQCQNLLRHQPSPILIFGFPPFTLPKIIPSTGKNHQCLQLNANLEQRQLFVWNMTLHFCSPAHGHFLLAKTCNHFADCSPSEGNEKRCFMGNWSFLKAGLLPSCTHGDRQCLTNTYCLLQSNSVFFFMFYYYLFSAITSKPLNYRLTPPHLLNLAWIP